MRRVGNSVCTGFAVAMATLFGFFGGDDVTVAAATAVGIHKELFGAKVVKLGLCDGQHDIPIISTTVYVVGWGS